MKYLSFKPHTVLKFDDLFAGGSWQQNIAKFKHNNSKFTPAMPKKHRDMGVKTTDNTGTLVLLTGKC